MSTWFKSPRWIPIAWLAAGANLAAVFFAAGEPLHATVHALLAGLFAIGARALMARQRGDAQGEGVQDTIDGMQQTINSMQTRVEQLEERVDFAERILVKFRDSDRLGAPPR